MSSYNNKLEGYQKNSKEVICFVEDSSNNIFDITNYSGFLYAKKFPIVESAALDISINHTSKDVSAGAFYFDLTQGNLDLDNGDYQYEIIIDDSSTNRFTVVDDTLNIIKSIS